jgi:hypothetical protein
MNSRETWRSHLRVNKNYKSEAEKYYFEWSGEPTRGPEK